MNRQDPPEPTHPHADPGGADRRRLRGEPIPPSEVEAIRRLVETSPLPYRAIASRAGVSLSSVSRLAGRCGWVRGHPQAPAIRQSAAGRRAGRIAHLADRLVALAEDAVDMMDFHRTPRSPGELLRVLQLIRLAQRADARETRRRRKRRSAKRAPARG